LVANSQPGSGDSSHSTGNTLTASVVHLRITQLPWTSPTWPQRVEVRNAIAEPPSTTSV
jgi:hypothetical protein